MLDAAVLVFPFLMILAGCMDLFTMQISNNISIALVVAFLPLSLCCGLPLSLIGLHYACGLFILVVTFALFAWGKIGGGDAKLAAASAIWMGWSFVFDYLVTASFLGGLLALFLLSARQFPLPLMLERQPWIVRLHKPKGGVPFGVALGLGGIIVYPQTAIWIGALGG